MRDRPKVGEILLEAGIIDEMQLQSALGEQARWGRRLGMTLVKLGMVQEGQLVRALARQFDMPVASLAGKKIAPEVIALVPARVAIEHTVIPLFTKQVGPKAQLFLGMEDPSDLGILDDLAFRTGMAIRPVMVAPSELGEAIDRYYNARPAPTSTRLPDPLRAADTLTETNLRRPREEVAPTLSELLKPGPEPRREASVEPIDATPLLPVDPEPDPAPEPDPVPAHAATSTAAHAPDLAMPPGPGPAPTPPLPPAHEPLVAPPVPTSVQTPLPPPSVLSPEPERAGAGAGPTRPSPAVEGLAADLARALEESERTRLVAKAIAHLLIEKGLLTYEELQARIEKMKPTRTATADD